MKYVSYEEMAEFVNVQRAKRIELLENTLQHLIDAIEEHNNLEMMKFQGFQVNFYHAGRNLQDAVDNAREVLQDE